MEEFEYLSDYYNNYDEEGRLLTRYGQVEFLTTMKYINKFLKKDMRVLEVGAGTGRYSLAIAKEGYKVDAIELVEHNIEILKSKVTLDCNIDIRQGNAIDLSCYEEDTFDITLVLGPLYHLFNEEDKIQAMKEAIRVTKKRGIIFISYCMNDATILNWGFKAGNILNGIKDGIINEEKFKCLSSPDLIFEMYRKEDIDRLMEEFNVQRLHFVATDLFTNHMREVITNMNDEMFKTYLNYHLSVCERDDLIGITHHSLDILRKN